MDSPTSTQQPLEAFVDDYIKSRRPKVSTNAQTLIRGSVNAAAVHMPQRSIEYAETHHVSRLMLIGLNVAILSGLDERDPEVLDVVWDIVADALSPW